MLPQDDLAALQSFGKIPSQLILVGTPDSIKNTGEQYAHECGSRDHKRQFDAYLFHGLFAGRIQ
jgi:hypothetical protein